MKRRRQILYFSIAILVILAIIVALCNISVDRNAEGRTFSNINDVPTMQTALLLGTNPKTVKDQVRFTWHVSMRQQNSTNTGSSDSLSLVETGEKDMTNHKQCATT